MWIAATDEDFEEMLHLGIHGPVGREKLFVVIAKELLVVALDNFLERVGRRSAEVAPGFITVNLSREFGAPSNYGSAFLPTARPGHPDRPLLRTSTQNRRAAFVQPGPRGHSDESLAPDRTRRRRLPDFVV